MRQFNVPLNQTLVGALTPMALPTAAINIPPEQSKPAVMLAHVMPVEVMKPLITPAAPAVVFVSAWPSNLAPNAVVLWHAQSADTELHGAQLPMALPTAAISASVVESLPGRVLDYALSDFIHPDKVTAGVVVTVYVSSWLQNDVLSSMYFRLPPQLTVADADLFVGSPLPRPTLTVTSWLSNDVLTSMYFRLPQELTAADGDLFVGSPLPQPTLTVTSWAEEVARTAVVLAHVIAEQPKSPVLVPSVTTVIDSWMPDVLYKALSSPYAGSDVTKPTAPIPTFTIDSWLPNLASNAVTLAYRKVAEYLAPDKVQTTALLSSWLEQIVTVAQPLDFALSDFVASSYPLPTFSVPSWETDNQYKTVSSVYAPSTPPYLPTVSQYTVAGWLQNVTADSISQTYSKTFEYSAPDKVLPFSAPITLDNWTATIGQKAALFTFAQSGGLFGPDKVLPFIQPTATIAGWASTLGLSAVLLEYAQGPSWTSPEKTLPYVPATVFLSSFLPEVGRLANLPVFLQATDAPLHGALLQVIGPHRWQQNIGQPALVLSYLVTDLVIAPPKVIPTPAVVSLSSWLQLLGNAQVPSSYRLPDAATAPIGSLPFVATPTIDSWTATIGQYGVVLMHSAGSLYLAPDKVLPPAVITLSNWTPTVGQNELPQTYARALEYLAPVTVIPFVPASITLDGWLSTIGINAVVLSYLPGSIYAAPDKVLALAPVTIDNWLQYVVPNEKLVLSYAPGDTMTKPTATIPFIPALPTIDSWLQYLPPDAQPPVFLPGDLYSAPTLANIPPQNVFELAIQHLELYGQLDVYALELYGQLEVQNVMLSSQLAIKQIIIGGETIVLPTKVIPVRLNNQEIEIDGLHDQVTLAYYNGATVTATLVDKLGYDVPGFTNISMAYIGGSQGSYRGSIFNSFNPPLGTGYTLEVTAQVASGSDPSGFVQLFLEIPAVVTARTQ